MDYDSSKDNLSDSLLSSHRKRYTGRGSHAWVFYSLIGSIFFTSCNLFLVELSKEGIYGYLFFCYGTLFASVVFFIHKMCYQKSIRGKYFKWSDLYFID